MNLTIREQFLECGVLNGHVLAYFVFIYYYSTGHGHPSDSKWRSPLSKHEALLGRHDHLTSCSSNPAAALI
ncbi:hypothetical protein BDV26DRAFT_269528 [Aspergillus bertholletiae]|uniref:Uncharacterized protein n=1 Tax=Aspergillus bertholletiae TaxID=1226010 RepID=A0A5N7AY43_9EURO|nr:hypothetical protein BDV26DRAFT_269528 [Aspergillus bertholletiae]